MLPWPCATTSLNSAMMRSMSASVWAADTEQREKHAGQCIHAHMEGQAGQAKHGMQTFNQSLAALYFRRLISMQTAMARSSHPDELQDLISRGPAALNMPTSATA